MVSASFTRSRAGLTLVEVVITMVILLMIIMATIQGVMFARLTAENTIRDNTASNVMLGYIEQIRSLDYSDILASHRDPAVLLETKGGSMDAQLNLINNKFSNIADELKVGNAVNKKTILLDFAEVGGKIVPTQTMEMEIQIQTTDLSGTADEWDAMQFDISYRYEKLSMNMGGRGDKRWVERALRFVIANTQD